MRPESMDQELNTDVSVSDILAEYRAEEPRPIPSLEEDEEPVRIYQPRRERRQAQEDYVRELGRELPALTEEEEEEVPIPEDDLLRRIGRSAAGFFTGAGKAASGLLQRLRRPEPEPQELLSFDELIYGKKEEPVRIFEDEEPAPKQPEETIAPEELDLDAILADYQAGLSQPEAAPVRSRRERRQEAEAAEKERARAEKERAREERAARWEARKAAFTAAREEKKAPAEPEPAAPAPVIPEPIPAEPEPVPVKPKPVPVKPEPVQSAPVKREKIVPADMSVDEILAEFWREQTEAEAPAAAPRSRRERARMREERGPLPPTDAASSAAERNSTSAPRPRAEGPVKAEPATGKPVPAKPEPVTVKPVPVKPEPVPVKHAPAPREEPPAPPPSKKSRIEDTDLGAMSVDEILAEYNRILAAMPDEAPAPAPAETPKEAPAAPAGNISRMQREARSFIDQMKSEGFAGLREESAYERPREDPADERPGKGDADEALRRLLDQDPEPVSPAPGTERPSGLRLPSEEIDPRFNLSGTRKSAMVFGDKELDLSADESYVPPKAAEEGFHWSREQEEEAAPEKPGLLDRLKMPRPKAKPRAAAPAPAEEPPAEGYDDRKSERYAPAGDYDAEDAEERDPNPFPSFRQYLSTLTSGILVRMFGARRAAVSAAGTMEDESEDLGPELSPGAASRYYGSFITSLHLRLRIGLVLMAVMAWISLGLPVTGALRTAPVAAGMVLAIQTVILLLGLDVMTGAAVNLARGRFGADSLAVLTCVLTSFDALAVALGVLGRPHMPLCLASSASFLGVMTSSLLSARGLRKALRVPAIGKRCYGVTVEPAVKGSGMTLLKSLRPPKGFVRRSEEAAPDETAFYRVSPILALLCVPLTLAVMVAKHAYADFLYILTALLCPAVPLAALLCFALPYLFGSLRIFQSGAAIAGWSGITDIGRSDNLIVTDRDLFPEGSVEIDTVRIFAEVEPETIISYAGSMICASGSDLAPCFAELMERNACPMARVEGFEYLTGGGMKGVIDGSVVLCGGVDLMRLMNVRVPFRLVGKTTVLLAVDGILCGIFNIKYEGQPQVRGALVGLIRSNRHPVFAIRDFLVTPEMLSNCFDVATDGYDFPPYVDRFPISEAKPGEDSKIAAVVCREGLGPLVHMADTGRSLYVTVRVNLALTIFAAVLGVLVVFFRLMWAGTVGSGFLLLFLLLWAIPVVGISVFLRF